MSQPERFDAIVIGAGEAGTTVASLATEAGHRVAMAYLPPYGSTCLNAGCVPSKYLIHRARVAHVARTAARFHIAAGEPRIDLAAMVRDKNAMIREHREHSYRAAGEHPQLRLIEGAARFLGPHEVAVGRRRMRAERIFVACGMRPDQPKLPGLDPERALTSETLMELSAIPERLIVLGGGYVACELGQAFRRFGSEVVIIQKASHLLPREEPDISTLLEEALRAEGITLLLGRHAGRIDHGSSSTRVFLEGAEAPVEGSHLLIATGRRPNTDGMQLEVAGVATRERGHIRVDAGMATGAPGIWAIGDVNGEQPFTRVCQEEAKVAFANAFEAAGLTIRRESLGHAVFTDPEIGSVGLTESEARKKGYDVAAGLVTFDRIERARLMDETTGLIKFVAERDTRRILGCHVLGPGAAELVYSAMVQLRRDGRLEEIGRTVGIFPTLHEGIEGAARGLWRKLAPAESRAPLASAQ